MPRSKAMDVIGFTSRRSMLEREKAVDGARNPGASKFGHSLAEINSKKDKSLVRELRKIECEFKSLNLQMNQQKKTFVKSCHVLNYDPIILVERPPSPQMKKKALAMSMGLDEDEYNEHFENGKVPHYMHQLRSKQRTPSTLNTIDAFTVTNKKKKNIWEDAVDQNEAPVFHSTVRPCLQLTKREQTDLQMGWALHKPRLTPDSEIQREGLEDYRKSKTPPRSITPKSRVSTAENQTNAKSIKEVRDVNATRNTHVDSDDEFTPFITQMAKVRNHSSRPRESENVPKGYKRDPIVVTMKSVRFSSSIPSTPVQKKRPKLAATKIAY
ncbi:uncharacterized protein LOC134256074 [Saccostrea cucullata]|uniref:uncharacterized protein LOC134256074 n=1 Tax=Saccostrea cuccullata TaxID=36930 RepID=UPI002ED1A4A3